MNHQLAVIDVVFRLGIEGDKVILGLTLAGHHADIVTAHQRIQAGHAGERSLRRYQPELRLLAQRIFHIALDAGGNLNFAQIFTQRDVLHRTDFYPLIADRRAARNDTVSGLEVDNDRCTAILVAGPYQPAGNQQRDDRQQPKWRDTAFSFNFGFSRRSGRFLTHVRPKVSGCPAIQQQG